MTVSTDSPNQGAVLPLNAGGTGGDGDGDGDGDGCQPVTRDILSELVFDSGAMANMTAVPPGPAVIPNAPGAITLGNEAGGGAKWLAVGESGGAEVVEVAGQSDGSISLTVNALHKAALNIGLQKTGGGFDQVRIWCEADYGPGFAPVPGANFVFKMGSPFPVEQPALSLEAPIFSADFVPIPGAVPPSIRWRAQLLVGVGGNVRVTRAYFYALQMFPRTTWEQIENCEAVPPPSCPAPVFAEVTGPTGATTEIGIGTGPGNTAGVTVPPVGGIWELAVQMSEEFDAASYTAEILRNGTPVVLGPPYTIAPVGPPGAALAWVATLQVQVPTPPADVWTIRVTETANPGCVWEQGFLVAVAS